jgi:hypothetical protein
LNKQQTGFTHATTAWMKIKAGVQFADAGWFSKPRSQPNDAQKAGGRTTEVRDETMDTHYAGNDFFDAIFYTQRGVEQFRILYAHDLDSKFNFRNLARL